MAGTAKLKVADSSTIIALLPPSSKIHFPNREATVSLTWRPIFVEPVNEIKGTLLSEINFSPTTEPEPTSNENIPE